MAVQLVEPETPREEIDQQRAGGVPTPDEKTDFFRVDTTPHGVEALGEVRIQRQHHRTGSNPGSEILQGIYN